MTEQQTVTVTGGTDRRTFTVTGETTAVTGLLVTPYIEFPPDGPRYEGRWVLLHTASARCHPVILSSPYEARELAARLAKVCDDWTGLGGDPKQWPDDIRAAVVDVSARYRDELDALDDGAYF